MALENDSSSELPPPSVSNLPWDECFVEGEDGTRLYVRERRGHGDAKLTAVLCDGIACDGFIWRYLADDLLPVANLLHWNYRGHGRSASPVKPDWIDMSAISADLDAIRRARITQPTVLIGHSLGCQSVLEGYRRRSAGIGGLVLICGAAGRVTHTFKGSSVLAQTLPKLIERVERHPQIARALWSNMPPSVATKIALASGEVDASVEHADLQPYMEHVADLDVLMFLRMLRAVGEQTAEDVLNDIRIPVLVISGELDSFTPPHLAEKMAASIPDSELMLVSGATHVVPLERRDDVRNRIQRFVRERVMPTLALAD